MSPAVPEASGTPEAQPLLSIIVPVLEPDAELDRCLTAIQAAFHGQGLPEVVVVTPRRFVASLAARLPWARVTPDSRKGIYAAMNDGARASRGRYLYFLGKDDIVLPAFGTAVEVLRSDLPFALSCDVFWGDAGVYSGRPARFGILTRNICHQGVIYSREAFDRHGPYLRRMHVQADHLLNIKVLWDSSVATPMQYFERPVAWYSGAGFSGTNRDPVFWRTYPTILQRYVGRWASWLVRASRCARGR